LNLYSRYLLTRTTITFIGFLSILICLIWFSRAISLVKYVTENGVQLGQFLFLFVLILPWLLLFIIPVSLFAAILITYNRLLLNNEITILKNSGLTKLQICRPILWLVILCVVFCYMISFYLMPYSNQKLRLLRHDFRNNYNSLSFNPQTFETLNNLTIYARNRDQDNNLFGIILNDERSSKYSVTITAKKGNIVSENSSALLYMEDGTLQKFNRLDNKSEILKFDNYVFNLIENEKASRHTRWGAKERFLPDLINYGPEVDYILADKLRSEFHQRLAFPLFSLVFSLIAFSCILYGQFSRGGNLRNIIMAISGTTLFLATSIPLADLIEYSARCIPLLYLNFALFIAISLKFLVSNYRKTS
jgi:lipopolysaccharide export system permease protein